MITLTLNPIFLNGYLECALWSTNQDDGIPLDYNHDISDIHESSITKAENDCLKFLGQAERYLENVNDMSQVGHDFLLTRNRHGSGFWDREDYYDGCKQDFLSQWYRWQKKNRNELPSQKLTEIAHSFGSCDLYVGDDGKLYFG